jgi:hypothetical protein
MPLDFERFMQRTYGFATSEWDTAQAWVRRRLRDVAAKGPTLGVITYSDLCNELAQATGIRLEPHGTPLAGLLGQINIMEREEGYPLISCVVVHKTGDYKPGVGFWNMAKEMNLDIGATEDDRTRYWIAELNECYRVWGRRTTR